MSLEFVEANFSKSCQKNHKVFGFNNECSNLHDKCCGEVYDKLITEAKRLSNLAKEKDE